MKSWQAAAVLGLALGAAGDVGGQGPARRAVWHTEYARARAEAQRTGKPLFVVFRCQP